MLYIVAALKPEAQAFVDKYKLKKNKLQNYTLFQNDTITLIISGIGVDNSRLATQALINNFDIHKEDIYLNIGICAAPKKYTLGTVLEIGSITYRGINYVFDSNKQTLTCKDIEIDTKQNTIIDMESFGFYDAVIHNPAIKKFHILKIVSDHFEPRKVTKEGTKSLLFNKIDAINKIIYTQQLLRYKKGYKNQ